MVFNSGAFLIFFPIVLLLYYVLPQRVRWIMLLLASYYFYVSWRADLIYLILFTTAVSYAAARIIDRNYRATGRTKTRTAKICLLSALIASLGVLFFFKYFNFLSESVSGLWGLVSGRQTDPLILDLILPVGISFYTFQTLSYVIDVYRGQLPAERHFGYYALYVSFFPQLVAGPIERPENLLPQLHEKHVPTRANFAGGGKKMLIGFFKKLVIADLFAPYVTAVYTSPAEATGLGVALATVLFAFQIYCDFSGYTDIAIGCSEIMGIRLIQNFDRPYVAQTIKEFWRRWHISLSSWFKDYIYFPLGGSRCSTARHMLNILIVFFVSGLWHGAAWTFVLWGLLHGVYQVIGYFTQKPRDRLWQKLGLADSGFLKGFRIFNAFILVCFGWIFFRANSTADLIILLKRLFTEWSFDPAYFTGTFEAMGLTVTAAVTIVLSLLVLTLLDRSALSAEHTLSDGRQIDRSPSRIVYLLWAVAAAWLILLSGNVESTFIYFQF